MKDYAQGAFEALSWVRTQMLDSSTRCKGCQAVLEEVETFLNRIQRGASVDFTVKLTEES